MQYGNGGGQLTLEGALLGRRLHQTPTPSMHRKISCRVRLENNNSSILEAMMASIFLLRRHLQSFRACGRKQKRLPPAPIQQSRMQPRGAFKSFLLRNASRKSEQS